jgi:hypothetical protein
MSWWEYVITAAVLIAGIYAFVALTRYVTGFLSQGSSRTADTMYGNYADSLRKQQRYARQHGGEWEDDEGTRSRDAVVTHLHMRGRAAAHRPDRPARRAA